MNIINFINNFKKGYEQETIESIFTDSNCFHFAVILKNLFGGDIIYDMDLNHFVLKLNRRYYDITGETEKPFNNCLWEELENIDPIEYEFVYDNCVLIK